MSAMDDQMGEPRKVIRTTAERPLASLEGQYGCSDGPTDEEIHAAQDVIECLEKLRSAWIFIGYIADKVLTPSLTDYERCSAGRKAKEIKDFLDEVSPYYEV